MGSTGYLGVGFNEAIAREFDGCTILARAAGVPGDKNVTWFAVEYARETYIVQVLWYAYRDGPTRGTVVKLVSEDMGPLDLCVPDRVWRAGQPGLDDGYATEWRARVTQFRERYPLNVRDLTLAHAGRPVLIAGRDEPWRYTGTRRVGRRSTCHVFAVPGTGLRRLPAAEERAQRCRLVDLDTET